MTTQNRPTSGNILADDGPILIVGSDDARGVAAQLAESATVRFASTDAGLVRQATAAGLDASRVDVTDAASLRRVTARIDTAVVAFDPDRTALLTAQLLRVSCGVETVIACIAERAYRDAFENADVHFLDASSLLAGAVRDQLSSRESEV
ncbi:TrkA-N domain-containing protein [Halorientalis persicus]|jgi:Trk K+ transport system NAD-binding subunit|uniref:TrkA-N domain-containing protein n=1 Tax=Halorientalis persicus TaxID=1367881 RepID=A0A1H8FGT3_9EURY|nr:NAD-binding protein [Halorientalis persicus]SEN30298.1 TrkA-N domain-containing protein [Halorientalis persicus]